MRQTDQRHPKRPLVDWTAKQIHDPVWRLRYLQSVAPRSRASTFETRWKSRKTFGLLTLLALGLVVAPVSLRVPGAANAASAAPPTQPTPSPILRMEAAADPAADVWPVEKNSHFEIYSNGLRIENQYAVSHR